MTSKDCNCAASPPETAPQSVVNPAGAAMLNGRVGTHATFFEAMKRRLSSVDYPQLASLRTRLTSDPAIALLDAWAIASDVLTFYNERIANEAYLRTATERRSLAELSQLIGYRPGPGVASSVFLAFTLEKDPKQAAAETLIPKGTAAKSVPGDGEMPQTFETSEDLVARAEWNAIKPRRTIPQLVANTSNIENLFLDGTDFQLKPNDRILLLLGSGAGSIALTVQDVRIDNLNKTTELLISETLFSIRRIYREISTRVDPFLQLAENARGFQWLQQKAAEPLTTLKKGDTSATPPVLPMQKWNQLSEYDERITAWGANVPETAPSDAKTELAKTDSPFNSLAKALRTVIESGCTKLIQDMRKTCDEMLQLDEKALKFYDIVKAVDETDAIKLAAAHSSLNTEGMPAVTLLTGEKAILQALFDAVTAATFDAARTQLKTWWGIKASGVLNVRSNSLQTVFAQLKIDIAPIFTYPFTPALEKIVKAADDVALVTPLSGSPAQERINGLEAAVRRSVKTYADALSAIVTLPSPFASAILTQLDVLLCKPIRDEAISLEKHKLAVEAVKKDDDAKASVAAAIGLADVLLLFPTIINERRKLFADEARTIVRDFDSLQTAPSTPVQDAWKKVKDALQKGQEFTGTKPTEKYTTPLNVTMESIGDETAGLIHLISTLPDPGDSNITRKLEDLNRELKRLSALNGGVGPEIPVPPQTSTTGGGIGQVTQSEGELGGRSGNSILHRAADEVLSIPANTAADVVAQLAASYGLVSREELKAKWAAVRNGIQDASAALLSAPLQLFGCHAPRRIFNKKLEIDPGVDWNLEAIDFNGAIFLNAELPAISTPSEIIVQMMNQDDQRLPIRDSQIVARASYGLTQKATRIDLNDAGKDWTKTWRPDPDPTPDPSISFLRKTLALVPTKRLPLAESRLIATIGKEADGNGLSPTYEFELETNQIELDGIYLGLRPGQWIAVEGERSNLSGVISREMGRIAYVRHILRKLPGDAVHTRIFLDATLEHTYKRDTVTIYANVVNATHGETVRQVLGSGDASKAFQKFTLAKSPLTYLAAPTPSGIASALAIRVNNLLWHEQETLLDSEGNSRDYVVQADESWRGSVQFGDGATGARLPTGRENVRAVYRTGLGTQGNVKAGAITQLAHRPLGVKDVNNPLPATGGADPENADQIRANAPLAVMALDRLVSVSDYADFAQNYAAIDKALAKRILIGGQPTVHVTIAGAGDIPIADDSDLFLNLRNAYLQLGDPLLVIQVKVRELLILFLSAGVRLLPDYEWRSVEPVIRKKLYTEFSFARRALGQNAYLSEVQTAIQNVDGVAYVDVDLFAALSQSDFADALEQSAKQTQPTGPGAKARALPDVLHDLLGEPKAVVPVAGIRVVPDKDGTPVIRSAQIAYLSPEVPDSLFLKEITS